MKKIFGEHKTKKKQDASEQWISVSDLMTGLMVVFLFISIALMRHALIERDKIKSIAVAYQQNQVAIYDALLLEFSKELNAWNAQIDKDTLAFEFKSPDILFSKGSYELSESFQTMLRDFFPRYMAVLDKFKESIKEVRIEGHTSSQWGEMTSVDEAYFYNMELSQARTRSVLSYIQSLESLEGQKDWIRSHVAAVGLSSSKPIVDEEGKEDSDKSRRVTFRVITNADIQISKIIQE
ncbi:OmpA family protein [Thorsellia kenyensis]|uniref:OmpA family protein n=1 Tax=Thorsellia kenyensis TaxID=1549888 RepID=A0ABV6CD72_9GAMM